MVTKNWMLMVNVLCFITRYTNMFKISRGKYFSSLMPKTVCFEVNPYFSITAHKSSFLKILSVFYSIWNNLKNYCIWNTLEYYHKQHTFPLLRNSSGLYNTSITQAIYDQYILLCPYIKLLIRIYFQSQRLYCSEYQQAH
jgi:hypothetical protein